MSCCILRRRFFFEKCPRRKIFDLFRKFVSEESWNTEKLTYHLVVVSNVCKHYAYQFSTTWCDTCFQQDFVFLRTSMMEYVLWVANWTSINDSLSRIHIYLRVYDHASSWSESICVTNDRGGFYVTSQVCAELLFLTFRRTSLSLLR